MQDDDEVKAVVRSRQLHIYRIGNGYIFGGRQFIERFKVGLFVPMHFAASGFESAWHMKEFTDQKEIPFWEISREGETIDI